MNSEIDDLVAQVRTSRKYRHIAEETIRRVGAAELAKRPRFRDSVKATKRKLHQIYGAFDEHPPYDRLYAALEAAYATGDPDAVAVACTDALGWQTSTRERIPILDRFYGDIFAVTGWPIRLVDLACGLNPLTLPWMHLPRGAELHAFDIDRTQITFINAFFALAGLPQLAETCDLLTRVPAVPADVVFLLKTAPILERQQAGGTAHVIEAVESPYVVVSFATKSLGRREKGMIPTYDRQMEAILAQGGWTSERLLFETELVYVVLKL